MTSDGKISRRDFLRLLAAGATTIAFGSVLGFSSFFSNYKNGRSGIGSGGGIGGGGMQQAGCSVCPWNLCPWSKYWKNFSPCEPT